MTRLLELSSEIPNLKKSAVLERPLAGNIGGCFSMSSEELQVQIWVHVLAFRK